MQIVMEYGATKGNGQLALDYGFVERRTGSSVASNSTLRDTFSLTLEINEEDRFRDDKIDIAEINGLGESFSFDLVSGQGPPEQMLSYLRLMVIEGPDAFLLEVVNQARSIWF
jgi:[ribulose-bisphosphate carboxylase]-lysine N-methyltransferase